jgi:hypothetical protein
MATDAAKVLWEESQPDGHYKSPGGLQDSISAFKRFSDYLAATKQDGHARSLRDITAVHIDGFEVYLRERHGEGNYLPYRRMVAFRTFLSLAHRHGLVSQDVVPRLAYISTGGCGKRSGRPKPRDPYSPNVAAQIRAACIQDIEAATRRLTIDGPNTNPHKEGLSQEGA